MGMENKTNFIIAVNGYKVVKKEKNANFTDVTVSDSLNKKVLLRVIEPVSDQCIVTNDVKSMAELVKRDSYDSAFLISKKFTDNAVNEMEKQKIQHVSDDYMPPFEIEKLYMAIVGCTNNQCQKQCGKVSLDSSDCTEKKTADLCRIKSLSNNAKSHFDRELVGLLKNDLKIALAITKP
ncbi:MAG: hypothetical protein ACLQO7_07105 [Candidatus Bathyarchaeia archaeon]